MQSRVRNYILSLLFMTHYYSLLCIEHVYMYQMFIEKKLESCIRVHPPMQVILIPERA